VSPVKVSIYIPAFNAEKTIKKTIISVKNQSYKFDEIIIIDDNSNDSTNKILKEFKDIKIIKNETNRGLGYNRNLGIKLSQNDIVASIDADVVLDPKWLEIMIKNFEKNNETMFGGKMTEKLLINRLQVQLGSLGGGGEVRLEFLDDVDRDSVKVDGKVLSYQASTGKFIGVTNSGGGGGGIANTSDVRDAIQGYYAYSSDFYTVGVANTSQELEEDTFTLVQPQIGAAGTQYHLPTVMSDVFDQNPWVGSAATIGTGQTQFSLAGLSSGASATVRVGCIFNPDVDNANLDVRLTFTTNTATQGTGLTNFSITKEQALIMNEGADQNYSSETIFSFFVGDTLEGTTKDNAGSFNIQVQSSEEGTFEMAAFAVNVVA